ncbi:MAG: TlpA disulfide reductase family protein [Alphaproteobacteria bacterium]|nr:TlpA disulfide reductase family protein [Alphaproteobacteria bacterium]
MNGRSVFLLAAIVTGSLCLSLAAHAASGVGEEASAFVATTRDGSLFDLSTRRDKVVLINFWTSWCKPCHEELPIIEALWRKYRSQGLAVLTINADNARTRKQAEQVAGYFTFPTAMIEAVKKNDLLTLSSVPVTYLIGKDGVVRDIFQPPQNAFVAEALEARIKALLDEKKEKKTPEEPAEEKKEIPSKSTPDKAESSS